MWQDMKSAPLDGTPVLLFCPDQTEEGDPLSGMFVGFYGEAFDTWYDQGGEWVLKPTHWAPLPDAPIFGV